MLVPALWLGLLLVGEVPGTQTARPCPAKYQPHSAAQLLDLRRARQLWALHGPVHYRMRVRFGSAWSQDDALVEVAGDRLVTIRHISPPLGDRRPDEALTVPGLFAAIERGIRENSRPGRFCTRLTIRYDPSDGHPLNFGTATLQVFDVDFELSAEQFEALP